MRYYSINEALYSHLNEWDKWIEEYNSFIPKFFDSTIMFIQIDGQYQLLEIMEKDNNGALPNIQTRPR